MERTKLKKKDTCNTNTQKKKKNHQHKSNQKSKSSISLLFHSQIVKKLSSWNPFRERGFIIKDFYIKKKKKKFKTLFANWI